MPAERIGALKTAIENRDVLKIKSLLRYSASPGNLNFENLLEICPAITAIAHDDDTLSALSYALWELALPRDIAEKPKVVDFLLHLMSETSKPCVHWYCASILGDYVALWPFWNSEQFSKILELSQSSQEEANRRLILEVCEKVTLVTKKVIEEKRFGGTL